MEIQRKNHSHTFGQKKVRKKKSNPWRIPRMRQRNAKAKQYLTIWFKKKVGL